MVTKFDRHKKDVLDNLVEFLIHSVIFFELSLHALQVGPLVVFWLSRVENTADYVVAASREADRISQAPSYYFAEQLVLDSIVKENRTTFNIHEVGEHLYQPRQVELKTVVE